MTIVRAALALAALACLVGAKPDIDKIIKECLRENPLNDDQVNMLNNMPVWEEADDVLKQFIYCVTYEAKIIKDNGEWNKGLLYEDETEEQKAVTDKCFVECEDITDNVRKVYVMAMCKMYNKKHITI